MMDPDRSAIATFIYIKKKPHWFVAIIRYRNNSNINNPIQTFPTPICLMFEVIMSWVGFCLYPKCNGQLIIISYFEKKWIGLIN